VACSYEHSNEIADHVYENNVGNLEKWEIKKMAAIGVAMC
jgi:hypothetical protein